MTNILLQFCALQLQHLHQIFENMSASLISTICHINLVSTDNESHNLNSYPFVLILRILKNTYFHTGII